MAAGVFALHGTPARARAAVQQGGWGPVEQQLAEASDDLIRRIEEVVAQLDELGAEALLLGEPGYPERLQASSHVPPALFVLGNLEVLQRDAVGVCGSRNASEVGIGSAEDIGTWAAANGTAIVAGNARGVDQSAQAAAVSAGGTAIAVLPEGLLKARIDTIPAGSAVVSEFPPLQPWSVGAAMERNKTVVALSQSLVVIEPGDKGGTLEAGLEGLRRKRPVFVLSPGVESAGVGMLRSKGATLVQSALELDSFEERPSQPALWD